MPHIQTISHDEADSELKSVYDNIVKTRGKLAEVHKIQSLNPQALIDHMDLYMTVMFGKSPLKRYQREMMAVVVSAANRCQYCIEHHEQALLAYWKDKQKTELLKHDRPALEQNDIDRLLCNLAEYLTINEGPDYSQYILQLKQAGLDDRAILDAVQVIAYFNFVNRLVLGLGVEFDEQEKKGYNY